MLWECLAHSLLLLLVIGRFFRESTCRHVTVCFPPAIRADISLCFIRSARRRVLRFLAVSSFSMWGRKPHSVHVENIRAIPLLPIRQGFFVPKLWSLKTKYSIVFVHTQQRIPTLSRSRNKFFCVVSMGITKRYYSTSAQRWQDHCLDAVKILLTNSEIKSKSVKKKHNWLLSPSRIRET